MNQQWTTTGFLCHTWEPFIGHLRENMVLQKVVSEYPKWSLIRISNLYLTPGGSAEKGPLQFAGPGTISGLNQCYFFWFWILNAVLITSSFFSCWRRPIITRDPKTGRERARCSGWVKVKAPRFYFDQNVFDFVNLILKCGQTLISSHIALIDQSLRKSESHTWFPHFVIWARFLWLW